MLVDDAQELKLFRRIALAEATSFVLLLVATVVKHTLDLELGVKILGPIHGALFLFYVVVAIIASRVAQWKFGTTLLVLFAAVVPLGGFAVDRWLTGNLILRKSVGVDATT